MDRIEASNKIKKWWSGIKRKRTLEWGERMESLYDDLDAYNGYTDNFAYLDNADIQEYIEESLVNKLGTQYKYDNEGRFYDHNQEYEIFGSKLSATEYSDYVCANTPSDEDDSHLFLTTDDPRENYDY